MATLKRNSHNFYLIHAESHIQIIIFFSHWKQQVVLLNRHVFCRILKRITRCSLFELPSFFPQPPLVTQVLRRFLCLLGKISERDVWVRVLTWRWERRRKEKQKSPLSLSIWLSTQGSSSHLTLFHNYYLLARLYFFIAVHNWRKRAIKWSRRLCVQQEKKLEGHTRRARRRWPRTFLTPADGYLQIYCVHLSRSDAQSRKAALLNNIQLPSSFCACYFIVSSPFLIFYANYREDWTWPLFSYTLHSHKTATHTQGPCRKV